MQFVFALTRSADGLVGGRLYRSDYYGKADTWDDRTNEMTGENCRFSLAVHVHSMSPFAHFIYRYT